MIYSEPETHSEHCQTTRMENFAKMAAIIIFAMSTIMKFSNSGRIFNTGPKVFVLCKRAWGHKNLEAINFDLPEESRWDILSDKYKIFVAFLIFKLYFLQQSIKHSKLRPSLQPWLHLKFPFAFFSWLFFLKSFFAIAAITIGKKWFSSRINIDL